MIYKRIIEMYTSICAVFHCFVDRQKFIKPLHINLKKANGTSL